MLSGFVLRWGAEVATRRLWGTLGFRSRCLPHTSGQAAGRLLEKARAARFAAAPWVEGWMERYLEELRQLAAGGGGLAAP